MNIYQLRDTISQEIVDFNQLKAALKDNTHPRRKIADWIAKHDLIRVKKGLYIFGDHVRREPYSLEVLANLIYGPSAISLNYALSYYGVIPERVHTITCITNKRNKEFNTPVGRFTYRYLSASKYSIGIQLIEKSDRKNILIAKPEKALSDLITLSIKEINIDSKQDFEAFIFDDLRVDEHALSEMSLDSFNNIVTAYRSPKLSKFCKYLKIWMQQ
jgi:hypothetical protein